MRREVNAIWNGNGSDGIGYLSTKSGAIDKMPYTFKSTFENEDGKLGTTKVTNINDENPFGINVDDPFGRDDILVQSDFINLENNKPVKILLRSVDVLHNWYVPQFRSKMDAVPGIVTYYWFEPNKVGEYEVLCAEYCGVGHYAMRGGVEVQSTEDYNKWLSEQETFQDLIAKQEKLEFENKKLVKNNNLILNKDIYKKEE